MSAIGAVDERKYGSRIPVTIGDRFHLGSCTKVMTATLLDRLVEAATNIDGDLARISTDLAVRQAIASL